MTVLLLTWVKQNFVTSFFNIMEKFSTYSSIARIVIIRDKKKIQALRELNFYSDFVSR